MGTIGPTKKSMLAILVACAAVAVMGPLPAAGLIPGEPLTAEAEGAACPADADPVRQRMSQLGLVEFTEEPTGGSWQTWFVDPSEVDVPPPPAFGSPDDLLELLEVKMAVENRTPDQALVSEMYGQEPAGHYWLDLYMRLLEHHAAKDGAKNPPTLARQMAIMSTAMYDALITVWHYKYCYLRAAPADLDPTLDAVGTVAPAPSYPSEHAAVAAVALTMLPTIFPCDDPIGDPEHCEEHPTYWSNETFNATESRVWGGANYRSDIDAGWAIGVEVTERVIAARANDGHDLKWDGTGRLTGPCNWIPNPQGHGGVGPLLPRWGEVQPFIMTTGSQFRAPPPPACDGPDYLAQYRDLYEASKILTDRQRDISKYWEMGQGTVTPPGQNMEIAMDKVRDYELSSIRAARVMSYTGVAVADAGIAAWDSKYTYWFDRPITAIRRLNMDTDDGICSDGDLENGEGEHPTYPYGGCWKSYATTPPFPGYISGHSTFTGAAQETLKHFFPDDDREFNAYQTEAAMARYYGGIHFRHDNDQGIETGRSIGHLLWDRAENDGADN